MIGSREDGVHRQAAQPMTQISCQLVKLRAAMSSARREGGGNPLVPFRAPSGAEEDHYTSTFCKTKPTGKKRMISVCKNEQMHLRVEKQA